MDLGLVFFYFFVQYQNGRLKFNRRFEVVVIFTFLWLGHLFVTGFLESIRQGDIPTLFYGNHMIAGGYAVRVNHMIYGPMLAIAKKIIRAFFDILCCYVFAELLAAGKENSLLKIFTRGNIIALPFVFISLNGRVLFGGMRFSPEIMPGVHMHPNQVGGLFLFAFFANIIVLSREKLKLLKFCHVLYCVIALCFILLSGARSCAVCLVVAFTFLFMTVWRKHLFSLAVSVVLFGVILTASLNFLIASGSLKENPIMLRMSIEQAEEDKGSGRLDTWWNYYQYTTMKQLFIGVGPLATTSTIFYDKFPLRNWRGFIDHPSNTYLYVLLTYGAGGFVIFVMFICKIFFRLRRNIRINKGVADYVHMGMLLGFCVLSMTWYMTPASLNSPVSVFWVYLISQAIRPPKNNATS